MPPTLDPELRRALADRIRYYNELGIYDFYRREPSGSRAGDVMTPVALATPEIQPESGEEMSPRKAAAVAVPVAVEENIFEVLAPKPEQRVSDPVKALKIIREDLGDCTRCVLHKQGRKQIVFGVGNPKAELMFVGEGPGADEDEQGEPFVGRAGQLLNNMIKAMGIKREDVYIANIVKCRPPGNRTPEREECETCSPFLMRQIAVIKPKVIVALGAVASKTLLAMNASMAQLRGRFYDFKPAGVRSSDPNWDGCKLAVTYHPAFLLRDPRQKGEAWKDLQMVMKELGLKAPKATT
jgi:uracil-DNA glycosylase family 4